MKRKPVEGSIKKVEHPRGTRTKRLPDFLARETGEPRRRYRDFFTDPRNPEVEEPAPVAEAFFVATIGEPPVVPEKPQPEPVEAMEVAAPADWPGPEHPAYQQALEAAGRAVREAIHAATLQAVAEVRAGLAEAVPDEAEVHRLAASVVVEARRLAVLDMLEGKPLVAPAEGEEQK